MKSIKELLEYGTNHLKKKSSTPRLDAEILLGFCLQKPREFLILNPQSPITNYQLRTYRKYISQREKHIPVAYITGEKEFYGLPFFVNPDVLVPRPETELLADLVINKIKNEGRGRPSGSAGSPTSAEVTILDIGTGSGCIALTLAKHLPEAKITACDISPKALAVARKNARNLKLKSVSFILSDLLENCYPRKSASSIRENPCTILVANLPYLVKKELKEPSIKHEPQLALYGGKDGLELYEKLFRQISKKCWRGITILLEIGEQQAADIKKLAKQHLPDSSTSTHKDLAGKDRVIEINIT